MEVNCEKLKIELQQVVLWLAYCNSEGENEKPEPTIDCPLYERRKDRFCKTCPSAMPIYADDFRSRILFHICKRRQVILGAITDDMKCTITG